jgi:methylated-DNA-protein-cysteine methyltransferase-like protein
MNLKEKVYKLVQQIPKGKVVTYGQIASIIQNSKVKMQKYNSKFKINTKFMPRLVGWILHQNDDSNVPCHRVVDRTGRLAPNFAFGGWKEQARRLKSDGVKFTDKMHVDLKEHQWSKF